MGEVWGEEEEEEEGGLGGGESWNEGIGRRARGGKDVGVRVCVCVCGGGGCVMIPEVGLRPLERSSEGSKQL